MEEVKVKEQKIISYLTFKIGKEHFALNVSKVINILEMQTITSVPKSPDYVTGIINLRGEVLPVIDTNKKLDLGETVATGNTCILVVESIYAKDKLRFGALVDSVQEVLEIEDKLILPPPSIGDKYKTELISGVVGKKDRFIMIIDINKFIDIDEFISLKTISKNQKK